MQRGTVDCYGEHNGFGYVVGDDSLRYFVHYSAIQATVKELRRGQRVEFRAGANERGRLALNVRVLPETQQADAQRRAGLGAFYAGRVMAWDSETSWGTLDWLEQGQRVFFHRNHVEIAGFVTLQRGDTVTFSCEQTASGLNATCVIPDAPVMARLEAEAAHSQAIHYGAAQTVGQNLRKKILHPHSHRK